MEIGSAKLNRRRDRYYATMTIPQEVRAAFNGQKQLRLSTNTSDKGIAEKRLFELEVQLRQRILDAARRLELKSKESAYQVAVSNLQLADTSYDFPYDLEVGDVVPRSMSDPPESEHQARLATHAFHLLLHDLMAASMNATDPTRYLKLLDHFGGEPPSLEDAQRLVVAAERELDRSFGTGERTPTVSSYLPSFQQQTDERVADKGMKAKSAKARMKNVRQFIEVLDDPALEDLQAKDAYKFAKWLAAEGYSNSTVKTRVSDISTLLDAAVQDGLLAQNPFANLKLSRVGTKGKHYSPLADAQLTALFAIPNLPHEVRDLWAVLICTGMRLEEAATCEAHQVREQDGVTYFDLRTAEVKNRQSQRRIPVCQTLLPLVRHLTDGRTGSERLFTFPIKSDGKSRASERCLYWMKKVDLHKLSGDGEARYTNHSMRGSFKDKMRDAGIALEVHNAILGHDQHTVAAAYGRGPSLATMKDAVDRAKHPYLGWICEA